MFLVSLSACGGAAQEDAGPEPESAPDRVRNLPGATVRVPPGWQLRWTPINAVIEPVQVLAASSFHLPRRALAASGCTPTEALDRLPPDGALIQVVEATRGPGEADHPNLSKYPPRDRPFRLRMEAYGPYECSGPSFNVSFRDRGRAFLAFVWLDPRRVQPRVHAQAEALLSSLEVDPPG